LHSSLFAVDCFWYICIERSCCIFKDFDIEQAFLGERGHW